MARVERRLQSVDAMGSWDLDPSGPRCVDDKGEAGTHGHLSSIKDTFRHEHPSHDRLDSSFCGFPLSGHCSDASFVLCLHTFRLSVTR